MGCMARAKVFMSGNSQAVQLPRELRFDSDEVEIFGRGDEVVLRERPATLAHVIDIICALPQFDEPDDSPAEDRNASEPIQAPRTT